MTWRLAQSLDHLRDQLNQAAPNRKKASDGSIGDAAHRARKSDHNPDPGGVVRAVDITNDPGGGLSAESLAESLRASQDPRIKYVIWNRRIFSSNGKSTRPAWTWGKFDGDPHTRHIHVSIGRGATADSDARDWAIPGISQSGASSSTSESSSSSGIVTSDVSVAGMPKIDLKAADSSPYRGPGSKQLQGLLLAAGVGPDGLTGNDSMPSGECGKLTKAAVGEFQIASGTGRKDGTPDFMVGEATWAALLGVSGSLNRPGGASGSSVDSTLTAADVDGGAVAFTGPLGPGSTGAGVAAVQSKLANFGYTVERNGEFGDKTTRAVKGFQRANGRERNGQVDAVLWGLLGLP